MLVNRTALILLMLVQASPVAWAETTVVQRSTKTAPPKAVVQSSPIINYWDLRLPIESDKLASQESLPPGSMSTKKNVDALLKIAPPTGLRLNIADPHPGLEYKFSEQGSVRLKIGAHGSAASTSWSF